MQGPTNPTFNDQLEKLRAELLPRVIENWDNLSQESQAEISTIGQLLQDASSSQLCNRGREGSKINEGDIVSGGCNPFAFGNESAAGRLMRTAAKAFTHHGSGSTR